MPRGYRGRSVARGSKPKTIWENLHFSLQLTGAASQTFGVISPEPLAIANTGTAVCHRMIGHCDMKPVGITDEGFHTVGIGVVVVTRDSATGNPNVPDPLSDFQQSWYYWAIRNAIGEAGGAHMTSWDWDIRTKRRLRSGYDMIFTLENPTNEFATDVDVTFRMLWTIWG